MFFLICRVAHAGAGPRTGRHPTGSGDRRAWPGFAPASALPPASAGAKRCFQAYSRLALIPNSWAITSADLRLASQLLTASRLNVSSNLRRVLTDVCVMDRLVHCRPNPPSVNSKQPEVRCIITVRAFLKIIPKRSNGIESLRSKEMLKPKDSSGYVLKMAME